MNINETFNKNCGNFFSRLHRQGYLSHHYAFLNLYYSIVKLAQDTYPVCKRHNIYKNWDTKLKKNFLQEIFLHFNKRTRLESFVCHCYPFQTRETFQILYRMWKTLYIYLYIIFVKNLGSNLWYTHSVHPLVTVLSPISCPVVRMRSV